MRGRVAQDYVSAEGWRISLLSVRAGLSLTRKLLVGKSDFLNKEFVEKRLDPLNKEIPC